MGAALLIGLLMSAGLMGGNELLKAFGTGPKMAKIQAGAMGKKHQMDLDTMALLSGKQLAREQELLGRQESLMGSQQQGNLRDMLMAAMAQQAAGAQAGASGIAQQAVAGLGAGLEGPAPGAGMVDMLRMS